MSASSVHESAARRESRLELAVAALVCAALSSGWIATLPAAASYGWDESMHAALPAARMQVAVAEGRVGEAFDALLSCAQYPFAYPVLLALAWGVFGVSEAAARALGIATFGATLLGAFVLVRGLVAQVSTSARAGSTRDPSTSSGTRAEARASSVASACEALSRSDDTAEPARERSTQHGGDRSRRAPSRVAPWLAIALLALSPLSIAYAGTLFLETASACAAVWALVAWIRAWTAPSRARALVAGAAITIALFTKWNYGFLLAAALAVDVVLRVAARGERAQRVRTAAWIALVPTLALAWWLLLPLPGGSAVARAHREALAGFLGGNLGLAATPFAERVFHATCTLVASPRLAVVVLVGLIASAWLARAAAVRTLVLVLLALWIPLGTHPFFLDRFLVPAFAVLVPLAALGLARLLPRGSFVATATASILLLLASVPFGAPLVSFDTAQVLGVTLPTPARAEVRDYQLGEIARRQSLFAGRSLPTAGLDRAESAPLLRAIVDEVRAGESWGWIGISSDVSPAVVHLELLHASGDRGRFLRDAPLEVDVGYFADVPSESDARLAALAARSDVVFFTEPVDLRERGARAHARGSVERLLAQGWIARPIARTEIARPMREPLVVTLFACRKG